MESKIDFPEEDLPKKILQEVKDTSEKTLNKIKKILDDQKVGEWIREGVKIGRNSIIGAGIIIKKDIKSNSVIK